MKKQHLINKKINENICNKKQENNKTVLFFEEKEASFVILHNMFF